jgi:hypothetical protein
MDVTPEDQGKRFSGVRRKADTKAGFSIPDMLKGKRAKARQLFKSRMRSTQPVSQKAASRKNKTL